MPTPDFLSSAQQLPSIPKVVQELIASFNDDNADFDQLARSLASDQALTAKVLRLANSARYGGSRQVGSVKDAVIVLGFNALRTLVLASGLTSAFRAPEHFDLRQFWTNSFTTAALCKWLAPYAHVDRELAFTCGMMHNLGSLLLQMTEAGTEPAATEGVNARDPSVFTKAGAALAEHWQFPAGIVAAIRYQLDPHRAGEHSKLATVVYLANFILNMNAGEHRDAMLAEFPRELATDTGMDCQLLLSNLEQTQALEVDIDLLLG